MFGGLHTLLKCKLELAAGATAGEEGGLSGIGVGGGRGLGGGIMGGGTGMSMFGGGVDEAYLKAIDAQSGGRGVGSRGGGAPDIMTLDDRD